MDSRGLPPQSSVGINNVRACAHCVVLKKMVPPSTDMPRVLCLKGFWAFCMRADVSQCFHRDSTGTDTTTGVADTTAGTANTNRRTANTAMRQLFSPKSPTTFGKAVRLSEKWYDFFTATAVSYSGTANTATATAIPRAGTTISRTYLMCERIVKRSWNVGNAPAHPRPLYLQGFQQICER